MVSRKHIGNLQAIAKQLNIRFALIIRRGLLVRRSDQELGSVTTPRSKPQKNNRGKAVRALARCLRETDSSPESPSKIPQGRAAHFLRGWFLQTRGRDHLYPPRSVQHYKIEYLSSRVYSLLEESQSREWRVIVPKRTPSQSLCNIQGGGISEQEAELV